MRGGDDQRGVGAGVGRRTLDLHAAETGVVRGRLVGVVGGPLGRVGEADGLLVGLGAQRPARRIRFASAWDTSTVKPNS